VQCREEKQGNDNNGEAEAYKAEYRLPPAKSFGRIFSHKNTPPSWLQLNRQLSKESIVFQDDITASRENSDIGTP
jgi:hypothetical protein